MADARVQRRLAAILAADVAGDRLIGKSIRENIEGQSLASSGEGDIS
jgi:hypothetical protein